MPGLLGLGASLGLLQELGTEAVSRANPQPGRGGPRAGGPCRLDRVTARRAAADRSAIVVAGARRRTCSAGGPRQLRRQGVVASCRRGRLRISPHIYNNRSTISSVSERLVPCRRLA